MKQKIAVLLLYFSLPIFAFAHLNYSESIGIATNQEPTITILNAYPNPAVDKLNLDLELLNEGAVRLKIINIMGSLVRTKELGVLPQGKQKAAVDVAGLNTGIYILKAEMGEKVSIIRFRKQ